jgi:very-short-patch-repair endonuclease
MPINTDIELTDFARKVEAWLTEGGLSVLAEEPFSPYQVDFYNGAFHIAIEADGPTHTAKADAKRDQALWEAYQLPVFHVTVSDLTGDRAPLSRRFVAFLREWAPTGYERRQSCL